MSLQQLRVVEDMLKQISESNRNHIYLKTTQLLTFKFTKMKRISFWSIMMMLMFALPLMTACGSDDNEISGSSYTTDEIIALLNGKWVVSGELSEINTKSGENFNGRYKGTIEFKGDKYTFDVTEGDKYNTDGYSRYLEEIIVGTNGKYTIIKKEGKNYINFNSMRDYSFEIVSLNKNSLKLTLDTDHVIFFDKNIYLVEKNGGHIYMTMSSN